MRRRTWFRNTLLSLTCWASMSLALTAHAQSSQPRVKIETNLGSFTLELAPAKAPKTVENFLLYVKEGFYTNTIFHRVIDGFMIQGGGFDDKMGPKPTRASIPNEGQNGLLNQRGTIAMARTSNPNSATAQFFINLVDNDNLNYPKPDGNGYAVFGTVVDGMDTVDKIAKVPTKTVGVHRNVPETTVVIQSAKLL